MGNIMMHESQYFLKFGSIEIRKISNTTDIEWWAQSLNPWIKNKLFLEQKRLIGNSLNWYEFKNISGKQKEDFFLK